MLRVVVDDLKEVEGPDGRDHVVCQVKMRICHDCRRRLFANASKPPKAQEDRAQAVSIEAELSPGTSLKDGQQSEDSRALVEEVEECENGTAQLEVEEPEERCEGAVAVERRCDGHGRSLKAQRRLSGREPGPRSCLVPFRAYGFHCERLER